VKFSPRLARLIWTNSLNGLMSDDTGQPSSSYNAFAPFASELDWQVAHWAVSEGIGHKSFNHLMEIPGVCLSVSLVKPQVTCLTESFR